MRGFGRLVVVASVVAGVVVCSAASSAMAQSRTLRRAESLLSRGDTAADAGDLISAITLYREAVAVAPRWAAAYAALGAAYSTSGRLSDAIEVFRAGMRNASAHPSLVIGLALAYAEHGAEIRALEALRARSEARPGELEIERTRVTLAVRAGRFAEALSAQRAVVRILGESGVELSTLDDARATEQALALLNGTSDRARSKDVCKRHVSQVRSALARCP
jgi:tetratricopeptide (TPR) repeat protein